MDVTSRTTWPLSDFPPGMAVIGMDVIVRRPVMRFSPPRWDCLCATCVSQRPAFVIERWRVVGVIGDEVILEART